MVARETATKEKAEKGILLKRPPVVVVMGHVDHGKTTLLDHIRKTKVAEREAGGITQSVGAYVVEHCTDAKNAKESANDAKRQEITFIDTPGHEAFSAMRARGVKVADVAVLVVAADDGVKPQTKEAIKIILDAKIPYVVALNKIDKVKDLTKVKTELTEQGVLLEGFGGSVSVQAISAKTGEGVSELLDLILLTADVEELTYDPRAAGEGVVLEAKLESKRGILVTGIMKNGTIHVGDAVATESASGKIRQMQDFLGASITEALPSNPILVIGFTSLPNVGEMFRVGVPTGLPHAGVKAAYAAVTPNRSAPVKDETILYTILKADVAGGLEALEQLVTHIPLPVKMSLKVVARTVGEITDGDIQLAVATGAVVIGFRTKITKQADTLARAQHVKVVTSDVVYDLVKTLELELSGKGTTALAGELEVLAIFGEPKGTNASLPAARQVVGGEVKAGEIRKTNVFEILRGGETIGKGRVVNLQEAKKEVTVVLVGKQCGLLVDADAVVKVGDHLIVR